MEQRRVLVASKNRARGELQQWREPPAHPIPHGRGAGELLLLRPWDMGVDVDLVGELGEEIEVADGDAGRQEWLDAGLAPELSTFRPARKARLEPGRDLSGIVERPVNEEFVLDRQIAHTTRRASVTRAAEHERDLELDLPARQNRELER